MVVKTIKPLNQLASFLQVQGGKITVTDNVPTRVVNKNSVSGHINIILDLIKESKLGFEGCTELEKAEVRQWIEYAVVYATQVDSCFAQIVGELNRVLSTKTYLVSHKLTVADVFLYYILQATVENLSILEKEKYVNVSRWFDNLQQNSSIRQSNKLVDFNTLYLVSVAPARH